MTRTPAQYAADRRRSHKAQAKKRQHDAAKSYDIAVRYRNHGTPETASVLASVAAMNAAGARRHLNFLLTGEFADFA